MLIYSRSAERIMRRLTYCPVCDQEAEEIGALTADIRHVDCSSCGRYLISNTAVAKFKNLPFEERRQRLEEAKRAAKPGNLPIIVH